VIFDHLTSGSVHAEVQPWTICLPTLVLIAQAIFLLQCRQTDIQTDKQKRQTRPNALSHDGSYTAGLGRQVQTEKNSINSMQEAANSTTTAGESSWFCPFLCCPFSAAPAHHNARQTRRCDFDTPRIDVDAFTTSTACCDLDLWLPESNQIINRGQWTLKLFMSHHGKKICPYKWTNKLTNAAAGWTKT